jgi:uncharacterized membrane protein
MEPPLSAPTGHSDKPLPVEEPGGLNALGRAIRTRIITGLILALPIVLTFWILYWLYATLDSLVLGPMAWLYRDLYGQRPSGWWNSFAAPLIAVFLVLSSLYLLGLLVRSSLLRAVDWTLLHVPVVTTIYRALSNVFQSLGNQMMHQRFQRVVLVEFPHPGMRALAFVTNSLQDVRTEKTILCVCVLTGVVPPAGFTLFVPEESVTDIDWTVNQTLQAILSGGITAPAHVQFFNGARIPSGTGPIIDTHGHPIEPAPTTEESVQDRG